MATLTFMGTKIFEVDLPEETHLMPPLLDYNASGYHVWLLDCICV